MDGSNHVTLINGTDIGWPNGLGIDFAADILYWADAKVDKIESVNFDGSNRKTVLSGLRHPFGLAIFHDSLIFSDWQDRSIFMVSRQNTSNITVLRQGLVGLMELQVYDDALQQGIYDFLGNLDSIVS